MLRFLIHLVADAHQPLHTVSLYSRKFPTGDRGGTLFEIRGTKSPNLHSFWDAMGMPSVSRPHRPLSARDKNLLVRQAKDIIKQYPPERFADKNNISFQDWLRQSYKNAKAFAYTNIKPFGYVNNFYKKRTQAKSRRYIALAGYRLAQILNKLFLTC